MGIPFIIAIFAIFAAGCVSPWLQRRLGDRYGPLLALIPLSAFVYFCTLVPRLADGEILAISYPWGSSLGLSFSFFVDGLSLLFLLVISGIGTFIVLYASGYLHGSPKLGRFYWYLMSFMGAMLGIVSSDHLLLLFIFWELTSITSYLLIGYYNEEAESRTSALQALLVTGSGGLAMLAGFVLLGNMAGTYRISEILALPPGTITEHAHYLPMLILVLLGAFTKSAQFPFHFWLPNAMAAPAPVSAFLHSATMVKAGVFLLARLHPALDDHHFWLSIVTPIGAITMLTGVFLGLGQSDLKKILAYTTLSVLGTLTMLLGLGTDLAIKACMAYLLAHALYKAALFMTAGSVDHETGTREVDALGGLRRKMPLTAAAALAGALSMAGIPLFLGFISKEYFYKALLEAEWGGLLWITLGVIASVAMFALALTAGIKPFWGKLRETPHKPHEAPWTMWIGPVLLGILAIKFGLLPGLAASWLVGPATLAVIGPTDFIPKLAFPYSIDTALILSVLTILLGIAAFAGSAIPRRAKGFYQTLGNIGPERGYFLGIQGMLDCASWHTRIVQNGHLRYYIMTMGGFLALLLFMLLWRDFPAISFDRMERLGLIEVGLCVLISISAITACLAKSRLVAIITLGVVGMAIAVLFILFSAPDLALTQVFVETLTVVLFVLCFYKLPGFQEFSSTGTRLRDAVLCALMGISATGLIMLAFNTPSSHPSISEYMLAESFPSAHGRNVVNVILVDFRALDTMGEITVLGIAALGVFAMLKLRPNSRKEDKQR